jgi:hypothetical protein
MLLHCKWCKVSYKEVFKTTSIALPPPLTLKTIPRNHLQDKNGAMQKAQSLLETLNTRAIIPNKHYEKIMSVATRLSSVI